MKKIIAVLCFIPFFALAQPGYLSVVAGNNFTPGYTGDGGAATVATMGYLAGVCADNYGNFYILDAGNSVIRKVNSAGIITTFAGGGSSTADGIAATAANIDLYGVSSATIDGTGNLYFTTLRKVRKISSSGIITTIAGTSSVGFSGDGGPATAAQLDSAADLCFDASGNLYISDVFNNRIRKVNSSGVISTIAGSTSGFSGDGGPATAAKLCSPDGLCFDAGGNLYVSDKNNRRIRKIDVAGVITTIVGTGGGSCSGDGGPATAAEVYQPSHIRMDDLGNLFIADYGNNHVRVVDPSGVINSFAGGGGYTTSTLLPASYAYLGNVRGVCIDNLNNVYIADRSNYRVCRVETTIPLASADSFSVFLSAPCSGPSIFVKATHYSPSLRVQTWFGDGSSQSDTFSSYSGCAHITHAYPASGTYTFKFVLYNGGTPVDTVLHSFTYTKCTAIPIIIYHDNNSNCTNDAGEHAFSGATSIAVDSNGVPIDTISCINGTYYNAYGLIGDVYTFRVISSFTGRYFSCPFSGVIVDTIVAGGYIHHPLYFGYSCDTTPGFDLTTRFVVVGSGRHLQAGNIYVDNLHCYPVNGTATLYHSPKYSYGNAFPSPTATTSTSITWNLSGLTDTTESAFLNYYLEVPSTYLTPGDTVNSRVVITPFTGDADTSNNVIVRSDTVRSSYDPNFIEASPSGHIATGTVLHYTVGFENDGNDTAHNIYVLDTLSSFLEPQTLRPVFASHAMYIEKLNTGSGLTVYKFDFPNIALLDSTHHGLCEGTFQYDIKVKNGLSDCTSIPARVGIYFDDNSVVTTNTWSNIIGCDLGVDVPAAQVGLVNVYPNPACNTLNIEVDGPMFDSYIVNNCVGTAVLSGALSNVRTQVDIRLLPAGVYFVTLNGAAGNLVKRLVKI